MCYFLNSLCFQILISTSCSYTMPVLLFGFLCSPMLYKHQLSEALDHFAARKAMALQLLVAIFSNSFKITALAPFSSFSYLRPRAVHIFCLF